MHQLNFPVLIISLYGLETFVRHLIEMTKGKLRFKIKIIIIFVGEIFILVLTVYYKSSIIS